MTDAGFAILGAGIFAKEAYLVSLAKLGSTIPVLKAVYSRSEKSAQTFASSAKDLLKLSLEPDVYFDGLQSSQTLDGLLSRADIASVIIVLPINMMPLVVLKCLAANKHVLSEKPVGPDVATASRLIDTYINEYKPQGLIWRVAENFEAEPGIRRAADLIREGRIGSLQSFKANVMHYVDQDSKFYKTKWRTVPDYQGGFLLDGGVHTAAALRVLLPEPMTQICSFASLHKPYLAPHDTIQAIIKTAGHHSCTGTLNLSFAAPLPSAAISHITMTGSQGWLDLVLSSGKWTLQVQSKAADENSLSEARDQFEEVQAGVEIELRSFFAALSGVHNDVQNLGDPRGALQDVRLIQAALTSDGISLKLSDVQ